MELTPIQCQSCGAQLNIDSGEDQVQCPFCGAAYLVKVSGSTIGLRQVTESLGRIDLSTNAAARELRIARLREERRELEDTVEKLATEARAEESKSDARSQWAVASVMVAGLLFALMVGSLVNGNWERVAIWACLLLISVAIAAAVFALRRGQDKRVSRVRGTLSAIQNQVAERTQEIDQLLRAKE